MGTVQSWIHKWNDKYYINKRERSTLQVTVAANFHIWPIAGRFSRWPMRTLCIEMQKKKIEDSDWNGASHYHGFGVWGGGIEKATSLQIGRISYNIYNIILRNEKMNLNLNKTYHH